FADDLHGLVESNARVAVNIDDLDNFDLGMASKDRLIAFESFLEVGLVWHCEDHHVSFAHQMLHGDFASHYSSLIVVRANKQQSPATGRVRIESDHRN